MQTAPGRKQNKKGAPTISVALCTFNGESYLGQQLASVKQQSRLPDEIVICDDGSTDRTVELLEVFARSVSFPVQMMRNQTRLGPAQNFGQAIGKCTGDIISLCDQDDVWKPGRLAQTEAAFAADPKPAYVFSDADITDENGGNLGYRLWKSVGFTGRLRQQFDSGRGFDVLLRQNVVTGATLSFRSEYSSLVMPIDPRWMHDGWIALLLSAVGDGKAIDQPLIEYRQHSHQSIGAAKRSLYQQYLNAKTMDRMVFAKQADEYETALARLQEQTDFELQPGAIQRLQDKIQFCRYRSAIRLGQATKLSIIPELATGRYRRFALGWKSFAQDLFL